MKQYKLQEEKPIASFRPNDPAQTRQPQSHNPHGTHQQPQSHYIAQQPSQNRSPPQTVAYSQPPVYHQSPPQQHPAHQSRGHSPPVVFNYAGGLSQQGSNIYQRQSIVQTVGVPNRQFEQGQQGQAVGNQRQEQQGMPQAPQPTPISTPQQPVSRGSNPPVPNQQDSFQQGILKVPQQPRYANQTHYVQAQYIQQGQYAQQGQYVQQGQYTQQAQQGSYNAPPPNQQARPNPPPQQQAQNQSGPQGNLQAPVQTPNHTQQESEKPQSQNRQAVPQQLSVPQPQLQPQSPQNVAQPQQSAPQPEQEVAGPVKEEVFESKQGQFDHQNPQNPPQYPPQHYSQHPQYPFQNQPQQYPLNANYPYPPQQYQGQPQYEQGGNPRQLRQTQEEEPNLQQDMNELSAEERHRLWLEQQKMQMQGEGQQGQMEQYPGQYEYPPGEEGQYPPPPGEEGQYPPEYYQQGYGQYSPEYFQALQGEATLWKQRFFYLYEKFQTFCQRHDGLNKEGGFLGQQFLAVDSEQEWLALKQKYDSMIERMGEVKEQNFLILQEIQENVQQNQQIQNGASIKEEASRVWEHRYHQLLEQYESLSHHYAELQSSSMAHNDMDENDRVAMMNEKYSRLEAEYNHVVQELQNGENAMQIREEHEDLLKYTQQLQGYIQQLESENNNLMRGMRTSVDGSKMLPDTEIAQKMVEKDNEIKSLSSMIANLEERLSSNDQGRPKSNISNSNNNNNLRSSQLENQVQEMSLYCNELEQKLSMKDYEINGMHDKIQYMKEELHQKKEELNNNSKVLAEKLDKIENDLANRASQPAQSAPLRPAVAQPPAVLNSFSFEQDYEHRIKDYQKSVQGKNNEIRILEERIAESESQTRKISLERSSLLRQWQDKVDSLEAENRRKLQEKDSKLRALEYDIKDKQAEVQKKIQDKDKAVKSLETEIISLKDEMDNRMIEKDALIKNIKDNNQRLGNELKDKITEVSRIKSPLGSPNMRSPNQSFIGETFRHEEELRLLADQVERRSDEIGKLKKERDARNKQYKDLEVEYQTLQEENNKRRIEVNNLKRQSMTLDNLQLEVDSLRSTISKKNQQIGELKNSLLELERVRMELDSAKREVDKQTEISRMKNRDIQQLTDRNYELEEKIRQKDFRAPQKTEQFTYRNTWEDTVDHQEGSRRKDMEINRLKVENEQLTRSLRRETEELSEVKIRYPSKLKQTEEQLLDAKLKLGTLERKYTLSENRVKEIEENAKRIKTMAVEDQSSEASRTQEHFSKIVERLEEQIRTLKEKTRVYEIKVNDFELEKDSLESTNKELQMFKDENAKRVMVLNDRLQQKDIEIKRVREKESNQSLRFRKKDARETELEAALKSRDEQARQSDKNKEGLRVQLRTTKKQFEDYKQNIIEQTQLTTNKEMENISKHLNKYEAKFALRNHNFDFKVKDKGANYVFERNIIYQLKEENDFLRRELEGRGSSISLQKMRITQLQQEALLRSKSFTKNESQPSQDELAFYRLKNKELEERVDSHITVNRNLKERIEQLVESSSKIEEIDRQSNKIADLEHAYIDLEAKFAKAIEENSLLRNEISNSAVSESNDYEFQARVQELQRKIDQLSLERNALEDEVRMTRNQKDSLESRCIDCQKSLTRGENKIRILESEILRLREAYQEQAQAQSQSQRPSSAEKELRGRVDQLLLKVKQKDNQIAQENSRASHIESEYYKLEDYAQKLQEEFESVQRLQNSSNKDESETEKWKLAVESLEGSVQQMNSKITQLEGEAEYYRGEAQKNGGVPDDVFYFLEIIRSNYLELETFASEMSIDSEQSASLGERMIENCRRGLESCQYLNEVLTG